MKILWHGVPSNFPTGYGVQTKLFTRALKAAGHEVIVSPTCLSIPPHVNDDGIRVLSAGPRMNMGNDMIVYHANAHKPDMVLSMMDTFIMDAKKFGQLPWVAWQVIDSAPMLPELMKPARAAKQRVCMSRFGQQTLLEAGFASDYVPLAFDPEDYHIAERESARYRLEKLLRASLTGKFVLCMVAANMSRPSRKNFSAAFRTVKILRDKRGIDAFLYVHAECTGTLQRGEDLRRMAEGCGLGPDAVMFPSQYEYVTGMYHPMYLRNLYNACDLYLCTSRGEGFGVPLIDAQACGLPVAAVEFSAMPEVLRGPSSCTGRYVTWDYHAGTSQAVVDPQGMADVAEDLYAQHRGPHWREQCAEMAGEIARDYGIDAVYDRHLSGKLEGWRETVAKHERIENEEPSEATVHS